MFFTTLPPPRRHYDKPVVPALPLLPFYYIGFCRATSVTQTLKRVLRYGRARHKTAYNRNERAEIKTQ